MHISSRNDKCAITEPLHTPFAFIFIKREVDFYRFAIDYCSKRMSDDRINTTKVVA